MEPTNLAFQKKLCAFAFENLISFLTSRQVAQYDADLDNHRYPLFVTWQKNGRLRGCIGTFNPHGLLGQTLSQYSLIAALKDHRFPPISEKELHELKCEISLLSMFEQIQDPLDWEVGKHGIEIEFNGPVGSEDADEVYRGTYLPNVAPEQNWNQEQALASLLKKAGYFGSFELIRDRFVMIRRYQSIKFGLDYADFVAHKNENL